MKTLLKVDLLIGAIPGLFMFPWFGWWAILFGIVTGILWAIGGQHGHKWRFIGLPIVLTTPILWNSPFPQVWPIIPAFFIALFCTLGYGIPDPPDRPNPDPGSSLGRFWYERTDVRLHPQARDFHATLLVRGTIIGGILLSMSPWLILLFQK